MGRDTTNKILAICPTINRSSMASEMFKSIYETTSCVDVVFSKDQISITKIFNSFSEYDYGYFHLTNDDFLYKTSRWDELIIKHIQEHNGWRICYANDELARHNLCTAPIISKKIIDVTGWVQLPTLEHLCGDCVWHYIGQRLGILSYFPNVIIQHRHFINQSSELDDVYRKTNSKEMYQKDNTEFRRWVKEDSQEVINRIKEAMNGR